MTSFNEEQRKEYCDKIKEITKQANFILDDTSSSYIWKFTKSTCKNSSANANQEEINK
jgi:hypothetical protein